MQTGIEIGAASAITKLIVDLLKHAWPGAPSQALVGAAVLAGVISAILVAMSEGGVITTQSAAAYVIRGLLAAAGAVGLTAAQSSADAKRQVAQGGA